MSTLFSLKKGARLPSVELTLTSNIAYNLADATEILFVYRAKGSTERVTEALSLVDAPTKKVRLDVTAAMVDTIGKFECHVEITIGGKLMCFPNVGFDEFVVSTTIEAA